MRCEKKKHGWQCMHKKGHPDRHVADAGILGTFSWQHADDTPMLRKKALCGCTFDHVDSDWSSTCFLVEAVCDQHKNDRYFSDIDGITYDVRTGERVKVGDES